MKIVLTYDNAQPLDKRCLLELPSGQYVVANFDFRFDYILPETMKVPEEVHIGAWGNRKERASRAGSVVTAIKEAIGPKVEGPEEVGG